MTDIDRLAHAFTVTLGRNARRDVTYPARSPEQRRYKPPRTTRDTPREKEPT